MSLELTFEDLRRLAYAFDLAHEMYSAPGEEGKVRYSVVSLYRAVMNNSVTRGLFLEHPHLQNLLVVYFSHFTMRDRDMNSEAFMELFTFYDRIQKVPKYEILNKQR